LWAAGVLGALAIIIAVLIVVNAQDKRDRPAQQETSTSTTVIGVPPEAPPSGTP
jgi:serine/threonine-protein kinase